MSTLACHALTKVLARLGSGPIPDGWQVRAMVRTPYNQTIVSVALKERATWGEGDVTLSAVGVAFCAPDDEPNPHIGERLALSRAIRALARKCIARGITVPNTTCRTTHNAGPCVHNLLRKTTRPPSV